MIVRRDSCDLDELQGKRQTLHDFVISDGTSCDAFAQNMRTQAPCNNNNNNKKSKRPCGPTPP